MAVLATIERATRERARELWSTPNPGAHTGTAGWTRLGFAAGVSCAAALIGCTAVAFFGEKEDPGPAFSHRIHVVDQGFDCTICHETPEGGGLPTPPAIGQCMLCHGTLDLDTEKPLSRQAVGFYEQPRDEAGAVVPDAELTLRPGLPALSGEVVFDHAAHSAALGDNCLACHVGMDQSERVVSGDALTMTDCVDCHSESGRHDACSVCHSVIDTNWSPPGHELDWMRHHGEASRDPHPPTTADCAMCHSQSSCTACHQSMPPENHDEFFRLRGHGVLADLSRESCLVCHRSDSCIRCHESTRPTSHHGGFGSPVNMHCTGCHFPLAGEGCATCHASAPSHALAAPQPPDHVPGANCRLCHGVGAPLPHPDDGSNCAACHR